MAVAENPPLHPALRAFSVGVIVVLLVGLGLFVAPDLVRPRWPWAVTPFNARFLGGFYTAEMAVMLALLIWNRWAPGRLILMMAFVFTLIVSMTSLLHVDIFNFARKSPWIWFAVYFISAAASGFALWSSQEKPPVVTGTPSAALQKWLNVEWVLLALYGLGLLFMPLTFSAFWPWKIDAFHAQTYSAVFLSGAAGIYILSSGAAREDFFVAGLAQLMVGGLSILGLVLTDAAVHRVNWTAPGTFAWLALFAVIALSGVQKLLAQASMRRSA